MNIGRKALICFALLGGVWLGSGANARAISAELGSRWHWLGRQQLAAETNAARFMGIWNLPESAKWEAQFLDKLAKVPGGATNAASARLRPLLDDLVAAESYAEVRHETNQPGQLAFAIRLNAARAQLWETNLAAALEALTGVRTVAVAKGQAGWSLKKHHAPELVEFTRVGEWVLVGLATRTNALLAEWRERIARNGAPAAKTPPNYWLEADVDLSRVARSLGLGWQLPAGWPRIFLTAIGDGENVTTRGTLNFSQPLGWKPEPWNFPTNLMHEPLVSFTAARGVREWLAALPLWNELQLGAPPSQFYFWAQQGMPVQSYFAAPLGDATNRVQQLTRRLLAEGNAWLKTNGNGQFAAAPAGNGAVWQNIPFATPYLQAGANGFVTGGLVSEMQTKHAVSSEMLREILTWTNLVCYDREMTGMRLENWIHIGQLFRVVLHRAQLPPESATIAWFRAAAPRLLDCTTLVTSTGAERLSFVRRSSTGLTAVEWQLLADWFESPQFPAGLHTTRAPSDLQGPRPGARKPRAINVPAIPLPQPQ